MPSPKLGDAVRSISPPRGRVLHPVPDEFPSTDRRFQLTCRSCGKRGRYQLDRFMIDFDMSRPSEHIEEYLGFSRYIRCRHCDAGGPWEYGADVLTFVGACLAVLTDKNCRPPVDDVPLVPGIAVTFDGVICLYPTQGEEHLKKLIELEPENAFLWTRLGNVYRGGEALKLAAQAYRRAIDLDPADIEAQLPLGHFAFVNRQWAQAAEHYRAVLRQAREAKQCPREVCKMVVRSAIEYLLEAHEHLGGGDLDLGMGDYVDRRSEVGRPDLAALHLFEVDLGSERGMDDFCRLVLGEKPRRRWLDGAARASAAPTVGRSASVGRNERCPCGSGRKYKKCCGAP